MAADRRRRPGSARHRPRQCRLRMRRALPLPASRRATGRQALPRAAHRRSPLATSPRAGRGSHGRHRPTRTIPRAAAAPDRTCRPSGRRCEARCRRERLQASSPPGSPSTLRKGLRPHGHTRAARPRWSMCAAPVPDRAGASAARCRPTRPSARRTGRRRSRSYRSRSGSRGSPARTEEWRRGSRAAALRVALATRASNSLRSKCRAMNPSSRGRSSGELAPIAAVRSICRLLRGDDRKARNCSISGLLRPGFDTCNRLISLTCNGAMR